MENLIPPILDDEIQSITDQRLVYLIRTLQIAKAVQDEIIESLPEDDTAIYKVFLALSSRIYNHLLSGQILLRHGLVTDAEVCARGALEASNLLKFLIRDEESRRKWLNGAEYSPSQVRRALGDTESIRQRYKFLSTITHPNKSSLNTYAQYDKGVVFISSGPSLPRRATIYAFAHLLETSITYVDLLMSGLKVIKEEGVFQLWPMLLKDLEKVFSELRATLDKESS